MGKSASVDFSSCRHTTSGDAARSHASRLARRLLTLLMLKVAIFMPQGWGASCRDARRHGQQLLRSSHVSGQSDPYGFEDFFPDTTRKAIGIFSPSACAYRRDASVTAVRIVRCMSSLCARISDEARAKLPIAN